MPRDDENAIVTFNVSGKVYSCKLKHLVNSTFLLEKVFFSENDKDVEIDVGPIEFEHVLTYLKDKRYKIPQNYIYKKYGLKTCDNAFFNLRSITLNPLEFCREKITAFETKNPKLLQIGFKDTKINSCKIQLKGKLFIIECGRFTTIEWKEFGKDRDIEIETFSLNASDSITKAKLYYIIHYE